MLVNRASANGQAIGHVVVHAHSTDRRDGEILALSFRDSATVDRSHAAEGVELQAPARARLTQARSAGESDAEIVSFRSAENGGADDAHPQPLFGAQLSAEPVRPKQIPSERDDVWHRDVIVSIVQA